MPGHIHARSHKNTRRHTHAHTRNLQVSETSVHPARYASTRDATVAVARAAPGPGSQPGHDHDQRMEPDYSHSRSLPPSSGTDATGHALAEPVVARRVIPEVSPPMQSGQREPGSPMRPLTWEISDIKMMVPIYIFKQLQPS